MSEIPDPSKVLDKVDGTEWVRVLVGERWRWVRSALLRIKGDPGRDSTVPGPPGPPRRIEVYTGSDKVAFDPAFSAVPTVLPVVSFIGAQQIVAVPSAVTKTGCSLTVMRSKGALLLSAGPFETAPAGVSGTVVAIGN